MTELKWRTNIPYPRPFWKDSECELCAGWGTTPIVQGLSETPCPKGCELREPRITTGKAIPLTEFDGGIDD